MMEKRCDEKKEKSKRNGAEDISIQKIGSGELIQLDFFNIHIVNWAVDDLYKK